MDPSVPAAYGLSRLGLLALPALVSLHATALNTNLYAAYTLSIGYKQACKLWAKITLWLLTPILQSFVNRIGRSNRENGHLVSEVSVWSRHLCGCPCSLHLLGTFTLCVGQRIDSTPAACVGLIDLPRRLFRDARS